ncbi:MAG TPA: FHA domain-containing protein [Tepidisphaeraceae bacterium]|jgi:pSer/pThr/pTyr-binding forkhead associated (FHA) protein
MDVVLIMIRDNGERRSFSLTRERTIIGRREDADFRIPLSDVSRKHCRLSKEDGELLAEDLGSANGTYLNGVRMQKSLLQPGDVLQVGPVQFVVQINGVPTEEDLEHPPTPDSTPTGLAGLVAAGAPSMIAPTESEAPQPKKPSQRAKEPPMPPATTPAVPAEEFVVNADESGDEFVITTDDGDDDFVIAIEESISGVEEDDLDAGIFDAAPASDSVVSAEEFADIPSETAPEPTLPNPAEPIIDSAPEAPPAAAQTPVPPPLTEPLEPIPNEELNDIDFDVSSDSVAHNEDILIDFDEGDATKKD